MSRPSLTPCLICEKAVIYLWPELEKPTNLNSACDVYIQGDYGSNFDMNKYEAIICDECMDKVIQSKRVRFVGELQWKSE
jgi:hypothetical protein